MKISSAPRNAKRPHDLGAAHREAELAVPGFEDRVGAARDALEGRYLPVQIHGPFGCEQR